MKYISTGGAGDAFISFLKLKDVEINSDDQWLHVESNMVIEGLCQKLFSKHGYFDNKLNFSFEKDEMYIQRYKSGKWKDYTPVSSGQDLWCPLKGATNILMKNPFLENQELTKTWDVCIQSSGGAKNNRIWLFSPLILAKILRQKGFSVCLIGSDLRFSDKEDGDNFIGKTDINVALSIIERSEHFIGLSGLLNYYACAKKITNSHLVESEEHEIRYYHPKWNSNKIKYGTINEVLKVLHEKEKFI